MKVRVTARHKQVCPLLVIERAIEPARELGRQVLETMVGHPCHVFFLQQDQFFAGYRRCSISN